MNFLFLDTEDLGILEKCILNNRLTCTNSGTAYDGGDLQTIDGTKTYNIKLLVDTLLPIHSIVVVTSPIGDHAPPALAEIIINPANHNFVSLLKITFCKIVIKTIVAVKLSMIAERINARIPKIHKSPFLLLVLIKFLIV